MYCALFSPNYFSGHVLVLPKENVPAGLVMFFVNYRKKKCQIPLFEC